MWSTGTRPAISTPLRRNSRAKQAIANPRGPVRWNRTGPLYFWNRIFVEAALCHQLRLCKSHHRPPAGSHAATLWPRREAPHLLCADCQGRRRGWKCFLGSFAGKLHPPAHAEFCEQRRNVEFDGALGKIKLGGDLLVGQAAHDAAEHLFFPASKLD